ncbi:MAG: ORF6N domain-containing protein [Ruminococcus sp.]|nr:ORF6N domain-containing protein [Ruminococcus sp.]
MMKNLKINPIEQSGQRVLTTAQLAEAYETDSKIIIKNFNRNKSRYIEGVHFYCLTGNKLKEFFANVNLTFTNSSKIRTLYLWTEKGALLHAKSLNTDKAWEVYEFLVDTYFRVQEISNSYTELIGVIRKNLNEDMESIIKSAVKEAVTEAVSETVKVLSPFLTLAPVEKDNVKTIEKKYKYSSSKIFRLSPEIREQVDNMIISGNYSCQKIADFIEKNTGMTISYMTVSRYMKKYFKF